MISLSETLSCDQGILSCGQVTLWDSVLQDRLASKRHCLRAVKRSVTWRVSFEETLSSCGQAKCHIKSIIRQHTATHCNTLQHTATLCNTWRVSFEETLSPCGQGHCPALGGKTVVKNVFWIYTLCMSHFAWLEECLLTLCGHATLCCLGRQDSIRWAITSFPKTPFFPT